MTTKQPNKFSKAKPTLDTLQDTSSSMLADLSLEGGRMLEQKPRGDRY